MATRLIDGKAAAAAWRAETAAAAAAVTAERGRAPGLAVVLVGNDPASEVYVANKEKAAAEAGIAGGVIRLPAGIGQAALLAEIARLNADPAIDGILVQMPLPSGLDAQAAIDAIAVEKDVDGLHPLSAGRLAAGLPALVPCTPLGCMRLIRAELGPDLAGRRAVVIGRSALVGRPMATLLTRADCTVTIAHSKTRDLPALCREADILVAAVGRAQFVTADFVRPGALVIDVGINAVEIDGRRKLQGDVAPAVAEIAGALTPVPGGVGPMTIAGLLANTLAAARARGC